MGEKPLVKIYASFVPSYFAANLHFELMHSRERRFLEAAPFSFWTSHRTPNYLVRVPLDVSGGCPSLTLV